MNETHIFVAMRPPSFTFHSPIERLTLPEFTSAGIQVDIKRDDLIHPFISGNKWRKLKHVLADAKARKKKHLVTFGGAWSNHLLATACASAKWGFRSTAFVRGEEVSNPVLSLCRIFGMKLVFVNRTDYRDKNALYHNFTITHDDTYFIDEGGFSTSAADGCAEIIGELDAPYDHIFCPCGTGATIAGLAMGVENSALKTQVHGIPVLKNGDFLLEDIKLLAPNLHQSTIRLHTGYHFGGYAKYTTELLRFIATFSSATGILLEPVYTGKLFYALMDLARKRHFQTGDRILAIHTGGMTGILGNHQKITEALL